MDILVIKTNDGYFLKSNGESLKKAFINHKEAIETFHPEWFFSKTKPKTIEYLRNQSNINYRYELADETLESEKIPLVIKMEDTKENGRMAEWFCSLESLYILKSDEQEPKLEEVKFKLFMLFNIPEINFTKLDYPSSGQWNHEKYANITNKNIKHQEIDKICFPSIVLPERPCELSSYDSYKLIRSHIKQHINHEYAEITSDYDFCFTVKKRVKLYEPYDHTYDVNMFSKRKAKYKTRNIQHREYEVFEMTHDESNYKGYTPIMGFKGNTHKELKENIDKFLSELMEKINKPLKDCPHCKGTGVIIK